MKKIAFNLMLAASLFATAACDNDRNDSAEQAEEMNEDMLGEAMEDDAEFAVTAADGGMFEVQLGELAQKNGASEDVKQFGRLMTIDHGQANEELKLLASQKNITLPTTLSEDKQEKYNELAEKTGKEFDEAYAELMVKDHEEDIKHFKEQGEDGKDPDLKAWAAGKVAALELHLSKAKVMEETVD
ncbi:DUF4142 domain-containing protein [Persicitalea sp.]|uniref:DUF4142 domain-containing protein n=1 Tax=Persicitalea sp. TaxID=3100273 RepID=UPI0035941985